MWSDGSKYGDDGCTLAPHHQGGWRDTARTEPPPREAPYCAVPDEPPAIWFAPGGNYGPHKREFVEWVPCGNECRGRWRGWAIRVYPQRDNFRGRLVVRWYAEIRGRDRVHACPTRERAQDLACGVVDAEIFND